MREMIFFCAAGNLLNSCSGIHGNVALASLVMLERAASTEEERVDAGIHTRQRGSVHIGDISIFIFYHGSDWHERLLSVSLIR